MDNVNAELCNPPVNRRKRYPEYKLCVDWLGDIPVHWETMRLKFVVSFCGGGTPSKSNNGYWSGDIPWVSPKDIKSELIYETEDHITQEAIENSATHLVNSGAVLVVVRSGILRHTIPVAINAIPVSLNQDMKALIVKQSLISKYIMYLIRGCNDALLFEWRKDGATVESIEFELLANTRFPIPPLLEQHAIAAFLDRETAKIDALIEKKRQLISHLEEKRAAIISHAVTKGLDPDAPMKDSGVEWLGEIPAEWDMKKLKFISPEITVGIVITPAKYYVDEGVPCLRSFNVREGELHDRDLVFISPENNEILRKSMIFAGDLVAVRTGQPGTTAVVDERFHRANCIDLIIIRQSKYFDSYFMAYLANSRFCKNQFSHGSDGAIQQHFNIDNAKNLLVLVPSITEQKEIVSALDYETEKIDTLIGKIHDAIKKLQEYRTALISAAVTGKIDVRDDAKERGVA